MKAHRKEVEGAALVEVLQAAAKQSGQKLSSEFLAMSSYGWGSTNGKA
jgi:hypothetical protein